MIGIFENLPDEIIDKIWNYAHNKNMENICKNIKEISNYFDEKDFLIDSTKFIIESINNYHENSLNSFMPYWIDSLSKSLRLVHLRFWLNHFRIMKIICGKENMLKLFNHINSSSLLIELLLNKKEKSTNNNNTKFIITKEYYVPNDEKPLKYFCDNYLKKNGYNDKNIYSWDTAFKTLWLTIN